MKLIAIRSILLALSAVVAASAAPVQYNLQIGSSSGLGIGFTYTSPTYISDVVQLFPNQLSNLYFFDGDTQQDLFSVRIGQGIVPVSSPYSYVSLEIETTNRLPFVSPSFFQTTITNGPGGTNIYLDRDGTYNNIRFITNVNGPFTYPASLSVTTTPEPTLLPITALGLVAFSFARRRLTGL